MIKFFINLLYKNNPKCLCGYRMKPVNFRNDEYSWVCLWKKKCGYETYESYNGTLHWFKNRQKSEKKA